MGRRNIQEQRRLEIIKALNRCLLKKPYKDTTIKDIAAEAGINHGMLHYYFKQKEEILLAFVDYTLDKYKNGFLEWRNQHTAEEENPKKKLEAYFQYVNEKITLNRNLSKVFMSLWEISLNNRKVKSKIKKVYQEWIDLCCEPIKDRYPADDVRDIMYSVVAYLEGMAAFSVIFNLKRDEHKLILQKFQQGILNGLFPE